jgi:hypothetical protein
MFSRYAFSIISLVLVIGGIVWVQQHLRNTKIIPPPPPQPKPHLAFVSQTAEWDKSSEKNFREFEIGKTWHYDFLFRSDAERDVKIGLIKSGCGCASVEIAVLSEKEFDDAQEAQKKAPGESIPYHQEPSWQTLSADPQAKHFVMKAKEPGVIRANWNTAKKTTEQALNLKPEVWVQLADDPSTTQKFVLSIDGTITHPIRIHPARVHVGVLAPSASAKAEFYVWSPSRDSLDLNFSTGPAPDPLLQVDIKKIKKEECEKYLLGINDKKDKKDKLLSRVLTAYRVTVTVHERKGNQEMEQGIFYRKLITHLDGRPNDELPTLEIMGQVIGQGVGDVKIGGSDDQGRIRFKPFEAKLGASKTVELSTDARITLERFQEVPPTLEVELTLDKKLSNAERKYWRLKVKVPPNVFSGSFVATDAVKLRILEKGQPDRFVRIPLEGHGG